MPSGGSRTRTSGSGRTEAESSGSIVFSTIKTTILKRFSKRLQSDDDNDDVPLSVLAKRMRGEGRA